MRERFLPITSVWLALRLAGLGLLLAGCAALSAGANAGPNSPAAAAVAYQRAMEHGDVQAVMALSHSEMLRQIETDPDRQGSIPHLVLENQKSISDRGGYTALTVIEEKLIDRRTATVSLLLRFGDGYATSLRVFLAREQGAWKFVRFEQN